MWNQSPSQPRPTPTSAPPDPSEKKSKKALLISGISGLVAIVIVWQLVSYFGNGTTLFDLASCYAKGEADPWGCTGRWLGRSVGINVIKPNPTSTPVPISTPVPAAAFPDFSFASSVALPPALEKSLTDTYKPTTKSFQIKALKDNDVAATVFLIVTTEMSNKNWVDHSSELPKSNVQSMTQLGGFELVYVSGNTSMLIMGFPANSAATLGFTELNPDDTVLIIITGEQ